MTTYIFIENVFLHSFPLCVLKLVLSVDYVFKIVVLFEVGGVIYCAGRLVSGTLSSFIACYSSRKNIQNLRIVAL